MRITALFLLSSLAFGQTIISSGSSPSSAKPDLGSPVVFELDWSELLNNTSQINQRDILSATCQKIDIRSAFAVKDEGSKHIKFKVGFTLHNEGDQDRDVSIIVKEKNHSFHALVSEHKKEVEEGETRTISGDFKIPKSVFESREKFILVVTWIVK